MKKKYLSAHFRIEKDLKAIKQEQVINQEEIKKVKTISYH